MNEDLGAWVNEWQSVDCTKDKVVAKARSVQFQRRLALLLGWLAVTFLAIGCFYLYSFEERAVNKSVQLFAALLPIFIMGLHTYHELSFRSLDEASSLSVVKQFRQRVIRDVAVGQSWWVFAFVVGFIASWLPWKLSIDWQMYSQQPGLAYWGVGGIVVILICTFGAQVYSTRRAQRSVEALSQVIDELRMNGEDEHS